MIRKLSVFILLSVSTGAAAYAQQTPAPVERRIERIILSEPSGGSYLGVQAAEVTKENFAKYGLRQVRGVAVEKVVKDSPAARAGLQAGDVILKFNDEEVTSVFKLTRLLNEVAPDHQAKITILRGGAESELSATLGKREMPTFQNGGGFGSSEDFPLSGVPEMRRAPLPPNGTFPVPPLGDGDNVFVFRSGASRRIGVGGTSLTKQLGDYFGVGGEGLLVDSVRLDSPAARAGLKAGDVIVEADGKPIKNSLDLIRAVNDKKDGDVILTIVRDKNRQTLTVTPEVSKQQAMPFENFNEFKNNGEQLKRLQELQLQTAPVSPNKKLTLAPRIL